MLWLLLACAGGGDAATVLAVVDPGRPTHYFDVPFPSDDLRTADGGVDLTGFPESTAVLGTVVAGWGGMAETATRGFGANAPAWFRFEGPLDLPAATTGTPGDPVLLVDLDRGTLHGLELRFVADPLDDPFWGPHTLAMVPAAGETPHSGARLAAVVMASAGVAAPTGYALPAGVAAGLAAAGVSAEAAVATVYTVQDSAGQLRALHDAVDAWTDSAPWQAPVFKRVLGLSYSQGETEGGEPATVQTLTFEDGSTELAFLAAQEDLDHSHDLGDDWPMAVYQAEVPVPYFQGLEGQPWMRSGLGMLLDTDRRDGWFPLDETGLVLTTAPETDTTRVVLSLPKDADGQVLDDTPLLIWDHGTGGTAYNSVHRKNQEDEGEGLAGLFASAGVAVLGHDQPLYGTRYPLIDEGFGDGSLGFYSIVNLPVFRDNQRQGGLEGEALRTWAETVLVDGMPAGSLDLEQVLRFGHSLGSVTAHNGLVSSEGWSDSFVSGSGSVFAFNFLESGLAGTGHGLFEQLSVLFGIEAAEGDDLGVVLGAALGFESDEARARVDRLHPAIALFQWILDPADPSTSAHDEHSPVTVIMGVGDWQVPNVGTESLVAQLPSATLWPCEVTADYDPHHCLFREAEGFSILENWLAGLP
jgi:hypothetical protein